MPTTKEQLTLIDFVKLRLRIKSDKFNEDIQGLIDEAKEDMRTAGVNKLEETDPSIRRAVSCYARARFDLDHPKSAQWWRAYESIRDKLTLVGEYNGGE